jgi:hypothetical protein
MFRAVQAFATQSELKHQQAPAASYTWSDAAESKRQVPTSCPAVPAHMLMAAGTHVHGSLDATYKLAAENAALRESVKDLSSKLTATDDEYWKCVGCYAGGLQGVRMLGEGFRCFAL